MRTLLWTCLAVGCVGDRAPNAGTQFGSEGDTAECEVSRVVVDDPTVALGAMEQTPDAFTGEVATTVSGSLDWDGQAWPVVMTLQPGATVWFEDQQPNFDGAPCRSFYAVEVTGTLTGDGLFEVPIYAEMESEGPGAMGFETFVDVQRIEGDIRPLTLNPVGLDSLELGLVGASEGGVWQMDLEWRGRGEGGVEREPFATVELSP